MWQPLCDKVCQWLVRSIIFGNLYVIKLVSDLSGQLYVATFDSVRFIELLIYVCWTAKIYICLGCLVFYKFTNIFTVCFFTKNVFSVLDTLQLLNSSSCVLDTYAKVTLMSPSGQEITRSKTSIRRGQPNPLFKETFMFQVALFQLAEVTMMVSVYNKRSMKKKEMIGWFSLGLLLL